MPSSADREPLHPRIGLARWFAGSFSAFLLIMAGAWLARRALTSAAVTAGLQRAGAGDISFAVTDASPWNVQLADVAFRIKTQQFAARRVTLARPHWWQPTLGDVRIEGARVPLVIDGSDVNPWAWASYSGQPAASAPISVPADEIRIDGVLAIQAASLPEQPLALAFVANRTATGGWDGTARLTGPGLAVAAEVTYAPVDRRLAFHATSASLDLKVWQDFIQRVVLLPGGAWTFGGRLTGDADGTYAGGKLAVGGRVQLRDGTFALPERGVSATGVNADLEFTDFNHFKSKPGSLRLQELRSGGLVAGDVAIDLAFAGFNHIDVRRATLRVLGGTLTAEPFPLQLDRDELEATVLADGLDIAAILALSNDVPATGIGRVSGRLPLRIDAAGLRFGSGWLELKKGVRAEIQLQAAGLLTGGVSPSSPSYPILKKVEAGILRLHLTELRLDVRPPGAPPGRTAQLHLAGEPVDPGVKAPITLDLNVNGPVERLINLGLDRRVNFGPGK